MRHGGTLSILSGFVALCSCRLLVDSGATYHPCNRRAQVEPFAPGTTIDELYQRCWEVENAEDPNDVFADDGDLVIRVTSPASGSGQRWEGAEQGPLAFQQFDGDFLVVVRVEVLNQISGDLCMEDGNAVGLVVRGTDTDPTWSTLLISPFYPAPGPAAFDCTGVSTTLPVPPIRAVVESRDLLWGATVTAPGDQGVAAVEGEADLAVCRLNGKLTFYHRDPASPTEAPIWITITEHEPGSEPVDVGLTAEGVVDHYDAEGHFTWAAFTDSVGSDGCRGELEAIVVPPIE